jgi:CheY-like chemotaxis protein
VATLRRRLRLPTIKVVVLATSNEDTLIHAALRAGASGLPLKGAPPERLIDPQTPLREFLRTETGGAVALLVATLAALVWANVHPSSYETVWDTHLTVRIGDFDVSQNLHQCVNNGLMTLFFLVIGLEARRRTGRAWPTVHCGRRRAARAARGPGRVTGVGAIRWARCRRLGRHRRRCAGCSGRRG